MNPGSKKRPIAVAVATAISVTAMSALPSALSADTKETSGTYLAGDFHNHSTCSDGSTSMQKKVSKSMDRDAATPWGLDWFVQAGHGGTGNRNCTLVEDESLATPAYPYLTGDTPFNTGTPENPSQYNGPETRWAQSIGAAAIKGIVSGSGANQNMWRWQSIQEYQYPLMEYLAAYRNEPLFIGVESVVAGHEHTSMSVIAGQIPAGTYTQTLPAAPPYTALGDADALAQWQYCFDRAVSDTSRGAENQWDCSVPGSPNNTNPDWNVSAAKLNGANGDLGHAKTVEALKWMKAFHPDQSYYVPAHLERAGPFNPSGNNGFNVEHLRNFNNAAPDVAFGFESQPGHGASDHRGEYRPRRNSFPDGVRYDSVGGTTYGGTGIYAAQVGGVWDALLGEGRNWWFFASSDWHNRGEFGSDDRRSTQDFYPGEYQRNYTLVQNSRDKGRDDDKRSGRDDDERKGRHDNIPTPQAIVDGLRSGSVWVDSGQLIDRLAFVACVGNPRKHGRSEAAVEALATKAARDNTDLSKEGCATMGEKLVVPKGADVIVSVVVRDPKGKSYSPYSFPNPSLLQVGINQPLDEPVLDHVDVIRGNVTSLPKKPGDANYAGAWPDSWVNPSADASQAQVLPPLDTVPAAAKNATAEVIKTFDDATWSDGPGRANREYKRMTFRLKGVKDSQYVRVRGTNMPPAVPYETDASGNPLPDLWTNQGEVQSKTSSSTEFAQNALLRIPCTTVGTNVPPVGELYTGVDQPEIDGCPSHLPVRDGVKYVAFDVAGWSDLWFYSNPIFIEVEGSTEVAGVQSPDEGKGKHSGKLAAR